MIAERSRLSAKMREDLKNCESNIVMHVSIAAIPRWNPGWQTKSESMVPASDVQAAA